MLSDSKPSGKCKTLHVLFTVLLKKKKLIIFLSFQLEILAPEYVQLGHFVP